MGTVLKGKAAGAITLRILADRQLSFAQRGMLVDAWANYVLFGEEPKELVTDCVGAWIAIKTESDAIEELSAIRAEVGRKGGSKPKQTEANGSKRKQTEAEKKRIEENTNKKPLTGFLPAHTREEAGETPAPPASEQGEPCTRLPSSSPDLSPAITANLAPGLAERLSEAMKGAPLSVTEALDYATGPHCGLTPAQVLDWADWNSEKQWSRDSGGNLHTLTADGARASMRRWKNRQPEIERWRKARESRTGGAAGGDVTIRGVRVSSKGGVPDLEI